MKLPKLLPIRHEDDNICPLIFRKYCSMTQFDNAYGAFELKRFPAAHDPTLMAWDAADHLTLRRLQETLPQSGSILVLNDEFGALAVSLAKHHSVYHWTDSYLSQLATQKNAELNQLSGIQYLSSVDPLPDVHFDAIVCRVPKNLNYFSSQLSALAQHYPDCPLLCGVMQKFITTNVKRALERHLESLNPGRAERKARVITGQLRSMSDRSESDRSTSSGVMSPTEKIELLTFNELHYQGLKIANLPNVFSSQSIDIGARFLLENFPLLSDVKTLADLGCGNGILSVMAKHLYPDIKVTGFDESYMAVATAEESFRRNHFDQGSFKVSNILSRANQEVFDVVLCNPPFHQSRRTTTDTAKLMFKQSASHLNSTGELWVVANRHLGYYTMLRRYFDKVDCIKQNNKFVIFKACFD